MNAGETVVCSLLASALSVLVFFVACSGDMSSHRSAGGEPFEGPAFKTGMPGFLILLMSRNSSSTW
jgi:hypothetical protein